MNTKDVVGTVIPTVAFTIAAVLFIYMAAVKEDLWTLAAAVGTSVAAVLGIIHLAIKDGKQNP
jgi:hypothetical protein